MTTEVKGLVLRCVNIGESDKLISIFTESSGTLTALVKGGRSLKNKNLAPTQQFTYSSFVLDQRGDKLRVKEASVIESFFGLRDSIEGLSLAGYIVEVLSDVTTAESDPALLRLSLNCLYAISEKKSPLEKIKAAFEIRALSIIGFMPEVLACRECGRREGDFIFDIMGGNIECTQCHREHEYAAPVLDDGQRHLVAILPEGAKIALGYLIHCPVERLFAFNISDEDMKLLATACEGYLVNQLERSFRSLEFYKEVKR